MNLRPEFPPLDTAAQSPLLHQLELNFADQRKENPPDDWPDDDEHVSFLVISFEILRMTALVVLFLFAFVETDGTEPFLLICTMAVLEIVYRLIRPADRGLRKKLYRKGQFLNAVVVQHNPMAFDPELEQPEPATVVYSFDPDFGSDLEALSKLAANLHQLKDQDRTDMPVEIGGLAWSLYHEMCPLPRRPVPASLGAAPQTWLADIIVHPGDRFTSQGHLAVLALPHGDHWSLTQLVPGAMLDKVGA